MGWDTVSSADANAAEPFEDARRAAPKAPQARKRRFAMMTAVIDYEKCISCGLCIDICPDQAISMNNVVTIDSSRCTGCGSCVAECPSEAISMSDATQRAAL
jgi:2-oxoacid:acceptor oxidoreductase delta subunit (pyruvate/2-ketoisovalerate family)